jgi:hypothetical protein
MELKTLGVQTLNDIFRPAPEINDNSERKSIDTTVKTPIVV